MIGNFDHVHLYTADLEGTRAFYERTLGGDPVGAIPNSHGGENHLVLLGGQFVVISEYPPGITPQPAPDYHDGALTHGFGVAHLGLNVGALGPVIARLKAAGIQVHGAPTDDGGAISYVYFTAPDGVVIELTQYVLPLKLRPAAAALDMFNKGVHKARLAIGKSLVRRATAS